MSMASKESEQWILFLLALTEGTPDFQPDWTKLAQDTGLYKSGKAMSNAYKDLVKKYDGQIPGTKPSTDASVPEDSSALITPAAAIIAPEIPKPPGSGRKRVLMDAIGDDDTDTAGESPIPRKRRPQSHAAAFSISDDDNANPLAQDAAALPQETESPASPEERVQSHEVDEDMIQDEDEDVIQDEDEYEGEEDDYNEAMRRCPAQAARALALLAESEHFRQFGP